MKHPLFPEGCPLEINDHVNLFRKNHTWTGHLLRRLGTNPTQEKFVAMEHDLKTVALHAFEYALPFDKSVKFTAVGIRLVSKEDVGYDRVAIIPTEVLIPMCRAGMPLRWYLARNDYPNLFLYWQTADVKSKKRICTSVPRLLFNGPTDRHVRPIWSPLLLHPKAWVVRKSKRQGKPNRDDLPALLRLHKIYHERVKGHSWSPLRDAEKVLVRPEAINFEHYCTPSKR